MLNDILDGINRLIILAKKYTTPYIKNENLYL